MAKGFMVKHKEPAIDTNVYLYKDGDEQTALTGGWRIPSAEGSNWFAFDTNRGVGATRNVTKNTNNITLTSTSNATTNVQAISSIVSTNLINLTAYNKIKFEFTITNANSRAYMLGVRNSATNATNQVTPDNSVAHFQGTDASGTLTKTIDITSISGSYYVTFSVTANDATSCTNNAVLTRIWLE